MSNMQDAAATPGRSLPLRLGRGVLIGLAVLVTMVLMFILLNIVLLQIFDNMQQWQEWRSDHYWHLLAWRLMLYTSLALGWLKLKTRLSDCERKQRRLRFLKIEVMVVLLILLIELSKVVLHSGGEL